MKLLAIDTATEGCSATLSLDGETTSVMEVVPRKHAELILPMVETLLADAGLSLSQLDALAFGRGPGAFTGVRIATGVIQGLAFAADLPVVPVSTLQALAQRVANEMQHRAVVTAFDARMNEVYFALWQQDEQGLMQLLGEERVIAPELLDLPEAINIAHFVGAGSGWMTYAPVLSRRCGFDGNAIYADLISRAEEVAQLALAGFASGQAVSAEQALPVYLRNSVAWKKSG